MAGRLEPYLNEFPREARNNATDVKPMDRNKDEYSRAKDLSGMNTVEVLTQSREHSLMCFLVYKKKEDGNSIYRPVVVPKKPIAKNLPRNRIEVIDLTDTSRKTPSLSNLKKAVPTGKRIKLNQAMIQYKE